MTQYLIGCGACGDFTLVRSGKELAHCPGCMATMKPNPDWKSPIVTNVIGGAGIAKPPQNHGPIGELVSRLDELQELADTQLVADGGGSYE